ncbi:MAG: TonB-dependent receptor [Lentisphaeria bacterium]|nr:TonB-dependent receptor [Lentisphaeria bacterium]
MCGRTPRRNGFALHHGVPAGDWRADLPLSRPRFTEASGRIAAVLAIVLALGVTAAETAPTPMGDMVISARGIAAPVSQTPGGVGVVSEAEILLAQPVSLSDVTVRIPGISLSADGVWGGDVVIRGLGRNRVLFLVDGCRINTATDINAQFGFLSPYDIERIEVLKGPISALHGSGSIGGVVNVITRDAAFTETRQIHGSLLTGVGTNPDGFTTYASSALSGPRGRLFVSAGRRNYQNYEDADGDAVHNSQFDDWHLALKGAWRWDDVHTSSFQYRHTEGHEIGVPGMGLSLPAAARTVTYPKTGMDLLALNHRVTPASGALVESSLTAYWVLIDRRARIEDFPAAMPLLRIEPEADHETWGARWQNVFELGDHAVNAGLDAWLWAYSGDRVRTLRNGTVLSDLPLADSDQASVGVFAEDDWRLSEELTLNLGGRVDRITAESEAIPGQRPEDTYHDLSWNGHAGLTWRFAPAWSATLIGASSYRSPDLLDRFKVIDLGGGRVLYGTPELDPERSLFVEAGIHYTGRTLRLAAAAFSNRVKDLIEARPVSATREEMQNVNEARIHGLEIDAEWQAAKHCLLYANAAWTEGDDLTDDQYLRFTPPANGLAGIRVESGTGLWAALETEWSLRQDHTPPGVPHSDAWATLQARAGWDFETGPLKHHLLLALDNLLDTDYHNFLATSRGMELKEPGIGASASWRLEF